ncbi:MAG: DUF3137 domain-containing protein [Deinococcota bacterium]
MLSNNLNLYNLYDSQLREVLLEQDRIRRTTRNTLLRRMATIILGLSTLLVVVLPFFVTTMREILSLGGDGPGALSPSSVALFGVFLLAPSLMLVVPTVAWWVITLYQQTSTSFQHSFKHAVVTKLIALLSQEMTFVAESYVNRAKFEQSRLFQREVDAGIIQRYGGETHIYSDNLDEANNVHYELSELTVTSELAQDKPHKQAVLFKGWFVVLELAQPVHASILVYPRLSLRQLDHVMDAYTRARLEDPMFEQHFNVYTTDQVGVRRQLTPRVMEDLLALRTQLKRAIYLSFQGKRVYVALPGQHKQFEVSLFRSVLDPEVIRGLVQELETVLSIPRVLQADVTSSTLSKSYGHQ